MSEPVFDKDRGQVIERAGCTIIDSAIEPQLWEKSLEISRSHENVFSSIGLDPCQAEEEGYSRLAERCMEFIRKHRKEIVGVGEVGLDFLRVKRNRDLQTEVFRSFISLSNELNLPVVVHSRWAPKQAVDVLLGESAKKVVLHAFPGTVKDALRATEAGYLISIPTSVIRSEQEQELVQSLELKHLVTETDSPVMAPKRGERNEPMNVKLVVERIAELKGLEKSEVERITTLNATGLFGLLSKR